jgi:hypothetical protein
LKASFHDVNRNDLKDKSPSSICPSRRKFNDKIILRFLFCKKSVSHADARQQLRINVLQLKDVGDFEALTFF